jgi:hypothetical protein
LAEISYPFTAPSESGGTTSVSEVEWQAMAKLWGGDRIDFQLTSDSYAAGALPFSASVTNGRTVTLSPGSAFVGGFYYRLSAPLALTVEPNPTDKARKDTIVLRADLTKGSVNAAVVKGQPAASPVAPQPQRRPGDVWEMVLYEVDVPARDGAVQADWRASFDLPRPVGTPWNTRHTAAFLPVGTVLYDLDNNGGDTQYESFVGRDGYVITRHLGAARPYTPSLVNAPSSSSVRTTGRWRWIAPASVYFSVTVQNTGSQNVNASGTLGIGLPQQASGTTAQVLTGFMRNYETNGGLPNLAGLWGYCAGGSYVGLYVQSASSTAAGLDALRTLPAKADITLSGVYEAAIFS